jgi:hypothetical protein
MVQYFDKSRMEINNPNGDKNSPFYVTNGLLTVELMSGKIQVGMPMDAVYIAWGKPSEILEGQSSQGSITTWRYYGTHFEEVRYWSSRPIRYSDHSYYEPYLRYDYVPRSYVQAEVHFESGLVKDWQMLPRPTY